MNCGALNGALNLFSVGSGSWATGPFCEPSSLKGVMGECRLRECFDLSSDEAACNSQEGCAHDPGREACHEEGVEAYDCRSFVLADVCSSEARCVCE